MTARTAAMVLWMTVLAPCAATAHTMGQSYSVWRLEGEELTGLFHLPTASLRMLADDLPGAGGDPEAEVARHVVAGLTPIGSCEATSAPRVRQLQRAGFLQIAMTWRCSEVAGIRIDAIFGPDPRHAHSARFMRGEAVGVEGLLSTDVRELHFDSERRSQWEVGWGYLAIGVEHIAFGFDHLAFLGVLLLVVRIRHRSSLLTLLWMMTGFTLGHSLSLTGAVLGWVGANGTVIEALIGFTIVLVGCEFFSGPRNLWWLVAAVVALVIAVTAWAQLTGMILVGLSLLTAGYLYLSRGTFRFGWHWLLTVAFGVIHGFGFAGSLLEIGVPEHRLVAALAGFNVGVEVGQFAVAGLAMTGAWVLARSGRMARHLPALAAWGSATCITLGTYWFVIRLSA